jgi:death-on-curing protein
MVALLSINSYSLNLSQDQAYTLVMRVAQGGMTKEEISRFLEKYIQPK